MKRFAWMVMVLGVCSIGVTGCSSTKTNAGGEASTQSAPPVAPAPTISKPAVTSANNTSSFSSDPLNDPNSPLAKRVVYFDYDSSVVRDEFSATLEAHADYLAKHPNVKVTLEGHGDERGTREYNLSLGERRSQAVQQFLLLMNVKQGQTTTVSYGEERPAMVGSDDSAWSKNRRVEIVYQR